MTKDCTKTHFFGDLMPRRARRYRVRSAYSAQIVALDWHGKPRPGLSRRLEIERNHDQLAAYLGRILIREIDVFKFVLGLERRTGNHLQRHATQHEEMSPTEQSNRNLI